MSEVELKQIVKIFPGSTKALDEIDLKVKDYEVEVRDYGRGIPLGKVIDCVSRINTGGKYDSEAFQKSVGLNGVGTKAVNALSSYFKVESYREGNIKSAEFEYGEIKNDNNQLSVSPVKEKDKSDPMWGTTWAHISNLITGVVDGFSKSLELNGTGYRASVSNSQLKLQLGYSHDTVSYTHLTLPTKA